ncbi:hypothetical protein P9112_013983 [Eukaryota sp. TZLM1-RC]
MFNSSQPMASPGEEKKGPRRCYFPVSCAQVNDLAEKPESYPIYKDGSRPLLFTVVGKLTKYEVRNPAQAQFMLCDPTGSIDVITLDVQDGINTPCYARAFLRIKGGGTGDNRGVNVTAVSLKTGIERPEVIHHDFSIATAYINNSQTGGAQQQATKGDPEEEDSIRQVLDFVKSNGETSPEDLANHFSCPLEDANQFFAYLLNTGKLYVKPNGKYNCFG